MSIFWIGFITGFLIMSVFSFIAVLSLDNDDDTSAIIFSGIITWIVTLIAYIYRLITKMTKSIKYKSLLICPDGKIRYIPFSKVESFLENNEDYKFASFEKYAAEENWDVSDWDSSYIIWNVGNVRYAPRCVWKRYEKIK